MYIPPRKTAYNTNLRSCQYKILNNILFLKLEIDLKGPPSVRFAIWKMKHLCTRFSIAILSSLYGHRQLFFR